MCKVELEEGKKNRGGESYRGKQRDEETHKALIKDERQKVRKDRYEDRKARKGNGVMEYNLQTGKVIEGETMGRIDK